MHDSLRLQESCTSVSHAPKDFLLAKQLHLVQCYGDLGFVAKLQHTASGNLRAVMQFNFMFEGIPCRHTVVVCIATLGQARVVFCLRWHTALPRSYLLSRLDTPCFDCLVSCKLSRWVLGVVSGIDAARVSMKITPARRCCTILSLKYNLRNHKNSVYT